MTVIYIHGVKVRSPEHGKSLERPMLAWLGPKLGSDANYVSVYWGGLCADRFRWNLASRPRSQILGQGGGTTAENIGLARSAPKSLSRVPQAAVAPVDDSVLGQTVAATATEDVLPQVSDRDRPDVVAALYLAFRANTDDVPIDGDLMLEDPKLGALAAAAQSVADRWDAVVAGSASDASRTAALVQAVGKELGENLLAAGAMDGWIDRVGEVLQRAVSAPGDVVSTVLAEARPVVNEFVANFLGDVFTYLNTRGGAADSPGEIPQLVLKALMDAEARRKATNEPIVVVTHSMGGQLLYDALMFYGPKVPALNDLEISHWLTCGCQVSFFAELGLFNGQPPTRAPGKLPMPSSVKRWTNYYDVNDLVGFAMSPVFQGPTDLAYDTGYGLALAHTGYFTRPSFFAAMAKALVTQ